VYTGVLWDVTVRCTQMYCDTWLCGVHKCTLRHDCEVYTGVLWDVTVRCTHMYCETWLWGVHKCIVRHDCEVYTGVLWDGTEWRRLHLHQPAGLSKLDERRNSGDVHWQDEFTLQNSKRRFHSAVYSDPTTATKQVSYVKHKTMMDIISGKWLSCILYRMR